MASTSTNKQPCLIDRPFFRGAIATNALPLITESQSSNPPLTSLVQLLRVGDLPSEDAAVVETLSFVSNETYAYTGDVNASGNFQNFGAYVYMPNQAAPATSAAVLVGRINVGATFDFRGFPQETPLFGTTAPTPEYTNLTPPAANAQIRPSDIGKNEVLYLEKGYILCIGYLGSNIEGSGLTSAGISVVTQGGFY